MNIYTPIILVGVLVIITLFIILLDKMMGGGGLKKIVINDEQVIEVVNEDTVLATLAQHKIYVPSACGGKATCGTCKFRLLEGDTSIKPTEEPFLNAAERENGTRLSCQHKVQGDMKIAIPEELLSAQEFKTVVDKVEHLTYDIKLVRFKLLDPKTINFKPGQYAQIRVPGVEVMRAYSMASNPAITDSIELIIRMVPNGTATTFVHKALEVGDKIAVQGPFGNFFLREDSNREMICIAGGSGKAPIRSILHYLRDQGMPRKVKYFFGAKTTKDLFYTEEFEALQKEFPNFQYIPALSEPKPEENWKGEVGLITDVVDRLVGDLSEAEGYLCGSPGMINACIKVLKKHGMTDENTLYDKFS